MQITKIEKNGCGPCVVLGNMIEDLKPELDALGIAVKNVNVSVNPEAIDKYNISSVPVTIFEGDGLYVVRNGLLSRDEFLAEVQSMVKSNE